MRERRPVAPRERPPLQDSVDRIALAWEREDPQLPVASMEVVSRLARVRTRLDDELAALFARYDLSAADFAVLAALRRSGAPYRMRQSALMEQLGLTSGTVSVRINRLEGKGVVDRRSTAEDARGTVVALTDKGGRLFDEVAPAHLHNEDVLLSALTEDERDQLTWLLRKLLVGFEHESAVSPLGMSLAPAHVARRLRAAVGLSDTPGLLVTEVEPGSPAAEAGVLQGDLITDLDGAPLRSCVDLATVTRAARKPLVLNVVRGADPVQVVVRVPRRAGKSG